ncbi:MAG: glycosyl hydrolase family 32, partial [Bacteroidales bacterium]|nr:glycosyl hydrolase family 32 [Bacteroidales bacterium]
MKKMIFPLLLITVLSAFSCQKEAVTETPRDWDGTVNYFAPTEPYAFDTYYKPYAGYVADPMP